MQSESNLISLSEDELLIELGKALEADSLGAFPRPIVVLKQRGREFFERKLGECQEIICPNNTVRELALGGFTAELVAAVAGLIESITIQSAVAPLAILLCKKGLTTLCAQKWGKIPNESSMN